ncbi:peptidase M16 [Prosthecochloris sp. ZM]|nr:peptidase M16 [Prosthecochloris sp. ZM]
MRSPFSEKKPFLKVFFTIGCLIWLSAFHLISCKTMSSVKDYSYTTIPEDSLHTRIYRLENGLTVYMSPYHNEPRIYTSIAVRAGSKNDPAETTGLAHYLEHMLFKGTDSIGSLDYEREHRELQKIIALYEEYRSTEDPDTRAEIYRQIDSTSNIAAQYAVPNEYDKLLNSIGARGTNAYTWVEQTVYLNDIPANQLDKWLSIESERFRNPVMRLFHTELETVYEEKNMTMDSDSRKIWEALYSGLFTRHTYGTQTTIGEAEHLKNPSIQNVIDYYRKWYVPNNMAICLAGDFDPDETIRMIDEKFSVLKPRELPVFNPPIEEELSQPVASHVYGPESEELVIGFRFDGADSRDADYLTLLDKILHNQTAGLIDLNLNQEQQVLEAGSMAILMKDYSTHILSAKPREGQSLDDVRTLLLEQLELVKKGEFPDWLPDAVINDLKIEELKTWESNRGRTEGFVDAFIWDMDWARYENRIERMSAITKEEIMAFAREHYNENYVVVYKHHGKDKESPKIAKPPITPLSVNRDSTSLFAKELLARKNTAIEPEFLDFDKDISRESITSDISLYSVPNRENDLFSLYYVFDIGTNHSRRLDMALDYLTYLGTSTATPAAFNRALYRIGASFSVYTADDHLYIKLSGLQENFTASIQLLESLLSDARPNDEALEKLKQGLLKERSDDKLSKRKILFEAMSSYAKYGPQSPFTNVLTNTELQQISSDELLSEISNLIRYEHRVLYYGPQEPKSLAKELQGLRHMQKELIPVPAETPFEEIAPEENLVYVVDYDMTQAEILMLSQDNRYSPEQIPLITLFNEYYGGGMSSVVFQELREAKALAYSVFSIYRIPKNKDEHHYIFSYIGTQADKLPEALSGLGELMEKLPESPELFASAKAGIQEKIRTERVKREKILFTREEACKLGIDYDIRKNIYDHVGNITFDDISQFHKERFNSKKRIMMVLGRMENLDMETLGRYGTVKTLTLDEIFGY